MDYRIIRPEELQKELRGELERNYFRARTLGLAGNSKENLAEAERLAQIIGNLDTAPHIREAEIAELDEIEARKREEANAAEQAAALENAQGRGFLRSRR